MGLGLIDRVVKMLTPTATRVGKAIPVLEDAFSLGKSFLDFLPDRSAGVPDAFQMPKLRPIDQEGGPQIGLQRVLSGPDFVARYKASLERSPSYLAMNRAAQELAGNIVNPNPGGPGRIVYSKQSTIRGGNPVRTKSASSRTV